MADLAPPHHQLSVDRTLGALRLRVDVTLAAPWTLLFGPSGSGKSSLLRAACGLLGSSGVHFSRLESSGWETPLITPQHGLPSHRLGLGYAPQQGPLFPHLTIAENIAFSWSVRDGRRSGHELQALLDLFEISPLRSRSPHMLSGGERQRVNLARAFAVPDARLLLLDEPFAGLGRPLRDRLLDRMQSWIAQRGLPVLSVSHDVDEALLLLGAEVVVLEEGEVVRQGPPGEALTEERERLRHVLRL